MGDDDGGHIAPSVRRYIRDARIATDYDTYFRDFSLFRTDAAILDAMLPVAGPLIDLGCGTGRHLVQFARRGFPVTGVDLSESMLEIVRAKLASEGLSGELMFGDICELDRLPPSSFRYALCMFSTLGLISGAAHRLAFLRGVHRLLEAEGAFVCHVHNRFYNLCTPEGRRWLVRSYLEGAVSRIRGGGPEVGDQVLPWYRGIREMKIHVFSRRELRRLLRRAGFGRIEILSLTPRRDAVEAFSPFGVKANGFIARAEK